MFQPFPSKKAINKFDFSNYLIDPSVDGRVEDAGHEQGFNVTSVDVELTRDESILILV